MLALFAVAVLAPLLYIPGFLFERAIRGATTTPDLLERHFERTILGALFSGWLTFTLAELGVFSLWLFLALDLLVCVIALLIARRRGGIIIRPAPLGIVARPPSTIAAATTAGANHRLLAIGIAIALAALMIVLVGRPFEVILGVRDAGFYSNTGFSIAHHGGILQYDDILAQIGQDKQSSDPTIVAAASQAETNFLSKQDGTRFLLTGIRSPGFFFEKEKIAQGTVIPQGFHLFPAWIGLLTSMLGMQGGLLATGLMGFLGTWSLGMLGRRIGGPWVGLLAALLLMVNGVQVWFSRYSTTETTAQFLTFAGLWAFAALHEPTEKNAPSRSVYALIAGLAVGQWALVRIEFVLVVAPVLVYLLYVWLTRRWQRPTTVLALAMGLMLVQAALHIAFISRGYFFDTLFARLQDKSAIVALLTLPFLNDTLRTIYLTTPRSLINYLATDVTPHSPLRLIGEVVVLVLLVVGLFLLRRWQTPFRWLEQRLTRWAPWLLRIAAAIIVLVSSYAYLIRPQILTPTTLAAAPTCLAPTQLRQPEGPCLALQGYIGAPIASPEHPDPLAYWADSLPKLLRQPRLQSIRDVAASAETPLRDLPTLEGRPSPGLIIDQLATNETAQLLGRSTDSNSLLVRDARGVTGWVDASALGFDAAAVAQLPEQADRILARIVNPRWATSFSPGNPSESVKFAIYQASMVRFGWYLSPLGILLAVAGLALMTRRMTAASWLLLVVCGLATYVFLEQAYGTDEATYIYLLRRFVPQVYPLFSLAAAVALVALGRLGLRFQTRLPRLATLVAASGIALALIGFLVATNLKLYRHTEYAGALDQIGAAAAEFQPNDVLLFRGGAPTYAAYRDQPDNVTTPLTYAFDRNALTIKSEKPSNYANDLAQYIKRWQQQGRNVYMLLGPSGSLSLPGLQQEKVDVLSLDLREFEQLTNQKPSNSYSQTLDYTVYRLTPGDASTIPSEIGPTDYGSELRGFYRPELFKGLKLAWTDGDALLRLPWPKNDQPFTVEVTVSPGARPTTLGPAEACLSFRPESSLFVERPDAPAFSAPQCATLAEGSNTLRLMINPAATGRPATNTFLLRLTATPWIPSRDDPGNNDGRALGVLFGGAAIRQ